MSLFIQMLFVKSTFKMYQEKMSTFKISTSVLVLLKFVPWKHVFAFSLSFWPRNVRTSRKSQFSTKDHQMCCLWRHLLTFTRSFRRRRSPRHWRWQRRRPDHQLPRGCRFESRWKLGYGGLAHTHHSGHAPLAECQQNLR